MKSLIQTTFTKKIVVPSIAVMLALASTTLMAPVFAIDFQHDPTIQKNSDHSLTASFFVTELQGPNGAAKVFLTSSGGDVKFTCVNDKDKGAPQTKETSFGGLEGEAAEHDGGTFIGDVSMGPPSLSAKDLCHTDKLNVKIGSITYNDVVLHAQLLEDASQHITYEFGDIDP